MNKMHNGDTRMQCFCNLFIPHSLFKIAGTGHRFPAQRDRPQQGAGNLYSPLVSKAGRTRATSHPCERGAGLLEI
jgi:hypothetical protein